MRILRVRPGFQADHSSSSYLFYAQDGEVSAAGQRIAHRFSSHADVDGQFARYQKWGESELSDEAYKALLGQHYDVMASESYDSWKLMIAVPKTKDREELLEVFHDIDDGEFVRLDVHDYGKRLGIEVYCEFDYEGPVFQSHEDPLEELVELLVEVRGEIIEGNISFLQAVAAFYLSETEESEDEEEDFEVPEDWSKAQLQEECERRGIAFRKSWTKDELRQALTSAVSPMDRIGKPGKLSRAASRIVKSLTHI